MSWPGPITPSYKNSPFVQRIKLGLIALLTMYSVLVVLVFVIMEGILLALSSVVKRYLNYLFNQIDRWKYVDNV
jgi:hypothetical protein